MFTGLGFLTRPLAILSAFLTAVTVAFLNDRFFFFLTSFVSKLFQSHTFWTSGCTWWGFFFIIYSFAGSFSEKATRTIRSFSPQLAAKMRPPLAYVSLLPSPSFLACLLIICLYLVLYRPVIRGRPSAKRAIYICGQPRWVFVLISSLGMCFSLSLSLYMFRLIMELYEIYILKPFGFFCCFFTVSFALWYISCGLFTVSLALLIGLLGMQSTLIVLPQFVTLLHPSTCLILFLLFCVTATILHATLRTPNLKARLNTFREEFRAVWRNYSEI